MRLIDADALIMALRLEYPMMPMFKENQKEWGMKTEGYRKAEEVIRDAPSIDLADYVPKDFHDKTCEAMAKRHTEEIQRLMPKRGEWIDMGDFEQCSVCKGTHLKEFQSYYGKTTWIKTPYCPHCGCRMKGADDETD